MKKSTRIILGCICGFLLVTCGVGVYSLLDPSPSRGTIKEALKSHFNIVDGQGIFSLDYYKVTNKYVRKNLLEEKVYIVECECKVKVSPEAAKVYKETLEKNDKLLKEIDKSEKELAGPLKEVEDPLREVNKTIDEISKLKTGAEHLDELEMKRDILIKKKEEGLITDKEGKDLEEITKVIDGINKTKELKDQKLKEFNQAKDALDKKKQVLDDKIRDLHLTKRPAEEEIGSIKIIMLACKEPQSVTLQLTKRGNKWVLVGD